MSNKYTNHWGRQLKLFHLPSTLFSDGVISLTSRATAALAVLYHAQKHQVLGHRRNALSNLATEASAKVGTKKLMERTGYTKNPVTKALDELEKSGYIKREPGRKKHQEFGVTTYFLLHPETREPMTPKEGRSLLYANDVRYFSVPSCIVTASECDWSMAKLSASEWRVYLAILYVSSRKRSLQFQTASIDLRRLSGLSPATFKEALWGLFVRRLVSVRGERELDLELCDPYTGEPLHVPDGDDENDPANYLVPQGHKGASKRLNLNCLTAEAVDKLIRELFDGQGPIIEQGNGDLMVCCCFHHDSKPSLSISTAKSCFRCFGCGETGHLTKLVSKVLNCDKGTAIQKIASGTGQVPVFCQPDAAAVARFQYYDTNAQKLLKEVLRFPNAPDGSKVIRQRRPAPGGWAYDVKGLPPMLYNRQWLDYKPLVFICEGEKDADNVTCLGLKSEPGGDSVAVTSGGADSWNPELANLFNENQRIVILPDDDEAGRRYASQVSASLEVKGIQYELVSFAGTGCKDVSEYLQEHTMEDLVWLIGVDWVRMPDGSSPFKCDAAAAIDGLSCEGCPQQITF